MKPFTDFIAFDLSAESEPGDTTATGPAEIPNALGLANEAGKPSLMSGGIISDGIIDVSLVLPDGSVSMATQKITQSRSDAIELARKGWVVVRVSNVPLS